MTRVSGLSTSTLLAADQTEPSSSLVATEIVDAKRKRCLLCKVAFPEIQSLVAHVGGEHHKILCSNAKHGCNWSGDDEPMMEAHLAVCNCFCCGKCGDYISYEAVVKEHSAHCSDVDMSLPVVKLQEGIMPSPSIRKRHIAKDDPMQKHYPRFNFMVAGGAGPGKTTFLPTFFEAFAQDDYDALQSLNAIRNKVLIPLPSMAISLFCKHCLQLPSSRGTNRRKR